jgi:hypothetical protein
MHPMRAPTPTRTRTMALALAAALGLAAALALAPACGEKPRPLQDARHLVGAYYYTWYPANFGQGYLRQKLSPRQSPELGHYRSARPATAQRHIAWCSRYGVDFLAVGWWPRRPEQNRALDQGLMRAANLGDIKFCIFYETWNLGFDPVLGITLMTEEKTAALIQDVRGLARRYFGHPSYLKIDGRPVIILYLTRSIHVNYRPLFTRLRAALAEEGWELFIIGDDIFWKVIEAKGEWDGQGEAPRPTDSTRPQVERIRLFDAVTAYNLYEGGKPHHAGYGPRSAHLEEVAAKYRLYRDELPPGVALVPSVMPGYNDRGVRPQVDHYVIPRQWTAEGPPGSYFRRYLQKIGLGLADPRLNLFMVTSFNEWNEDTQIEPVAPAPPTSRDQSGDGKGYTQGYSYYGYGTAYLETLRDVVCAVAGRVAGPGGPAAGVEVAAWRQGREVARDRTDAAGWFTLSRLHLPPGDCRVGLAAGGPRQEVTVGPEACALVELEAGPPERP